MGSRNRCQPKMCEEMQLEIEHVHQPLGVGTSVFGQHSVPFWIRRNTPQGVRGEPIYRISLAFLSPLCRRTTPPGNTRWPRYNHRASTWISPRGQWTRTSGWSASRYEDTVEPLPGFGRQNGGLFRVSFLRRKTSSAVLSPRRPCTPSPGANQHEGLVTSCVGKKTSSLPGFTKSCSSRSANNSPG